MGLSPADALSAGRDWWESHQPRLRELLCDDGFLATIGGLAGLPMAEALARQLLPDYGVNVAVPAAAFVARRVLLNWCPGNEAHL